MSDALPASFRVYASTRSISKQ